MRTNYSGFALAVSMGLLVLLLGFLALSAGGLVQIEPVEEVAAAPADSVQAVPAAAIPVRVAKVAYLSGSSTDGADMAAGDALFKANCAQCHAVNEKVVGPALAGITRRRSLPWITAWVCNSAKVIASGDEYAVKLYNDNGKQQMPSFPQLSDKDVKNILAFVSITMSATTAQESATIVATR